MDHPDFIVCSFIENYIGLNKVTTKMHLSPPVA